MSASESSPITTDLQESIEQLVAETVRRSQVDHDEESKRLRAALQEALNEVEAGQAAMNKAADLLRTALQAPAPVTGSAEANDSATATVDSPSDDETEVSQTPQAAESPAPSTETPETGPHEMDVVAHDVTIGIASSLQTWLRERPEVVSAQTREFVNGELRLKLDLSSALDMTTFSEWIAEHKGRIATSTSSVVELRFGD